MLLKILFIIEDKKTKMLDVDASGNLCLTNSIFSNEPFKLGINICPGTKVTDGSANQILEAALDVSGGLQFAFNDVTMMPTTNNLGSVSFFKDGSGNYRFFACEMDNFGNPSWRAMTESHALTSYWSKNADNLYYNDGNVGIGTNAPQAKLDVSGGDALIHGITVGRGGSGNNTNTAVGYYALKNNTTGLQNVAVGHQILLSNTTGNNNVAIGTNTLRDNTGGRDNVAIGTSTLQKNTTGYENVAIGIQALQKNTTGYNNVAIGEYALFSSETSDSNIAVGHSALKSNTLGLGNTALGYQTLEQNVFSNGHTAIGYRALANSNPTALGGNTAVGFQSLVSNETGVYNTAFGACSLLNICDGSNNVAIGYNSGPANDLSNTISIGANVTPANSNSCVIGDPSLNINVGIGTNAPQAKLHIKDIMKFISGVGPSGYDWGAFSRFDPPIDGGINNYGLRSDNIFFGLDHQNHQLLLFDSIYQPGVSGTSYELRFAARGTYTIGTTTYQAKQVKFVFGSQDGGADNFEFNGGLAIGKSTDGYIGTSAPANGLIVQNNVGIGTTSPGAKLDVNGSIKCLDFGVENNLTVYGGTTLNGSITINDNLIVDGVTVDGGTTLNGSTTINANLTVDGGTTLNGSTTINGNVNVNGNLSKVTGSFKIDHPEPEKTLTHNLYHSFVESPTAGDNLYRYRVTTVNNTAVIKLPTYFRYLNENEMIWVSPVDSFGRAYGKLSPDRLEVHVKSDQDGDYNVLVMGTRYDKDAKAYWKGAERMKNGSLY